MAYFMGEFAQNQQKQESELKRWSRAAGYSALVGAPLGAASSTLGINLINKSGLNTEPIKGAKRLGYTALGSASGAVNAAKLGLLGYGVYRGGNALINRIKNRKNKKSNYSLNSNLANFVEKEKKRDSFNKLGVIGATGLGGVIGAGAGATGASLVIGKKLSRKYKVGDIKKLWINPKTRSEYLEKVANRLPDKTKRNLSIKVLSSVGAGGLIGGSLAGYGAYRLSKYLRNRKREV